MGELVRSAPNEWRESLPALSSVCGPADILIKGLWRTAVDALQRGLGRDERLVVLAHCRVGIVSTYLVALTDQRLLLIGLGKETKRPKVNAQPSAVAITSPLEIGAIRGATLCFTADEQQVTLKNVKPVAEAARLSFLLGGTPYGVDPFAALGDGSKDPGAPPIETLGRVALYHDRVLDEDMNHLPLTGGEVRATVDTAGNLAVTRGRNLAAKGVGTVFLGPIGLFGMGNAKDRKFDTRELYLMIEGPGFGYAHKLDPNLGDAARKFATRLNGQASGFHATPTQADTGGGVAAQLERLAELRREGLLDEDEFRAAKSRLLDP